jgi:hypothetical protein
LVLLFCGAIAQQAQQSATPQGQRWLLVFGTSSAMKKRLPAVEAGIKTLFATDFNGKISQGDSIRVWTVGDQMKIGPLAEWSADNVPALTTNLITYLRAQSFSGKANLSSLEPSVRWVVANSDRVTILIYCDGSEQIDWSPFDGINDMLHQTATERKKSQQPVLIVLRAQQGKFIGGMVNFPPVPLSLPSFPPLPGENKPAVVTNPPPVIVPPAPPKPVAPLVIIGTHVSTNAADATNSEPVSSPPIPVVVPKTNPPAVPVTPAVTPAVIKTNPPVAATNPVPVIVQAPVKDTNQPVAVASQDDRVEKILTFGGGGLLAVAAALVVFLLRRKSSPRGSLITSSMQDNFRSRDQK